MVIDAENEHADFTGTSSPTALSPYRASFAFNSVSLVSHQNSKRLSLNNGAFRQNSIR